MSSPLSVNVPTALEHFATLVAEDAGLNLLEAAASIALDEHPSLDVQAVLSEVDALAGRLRQRLPEDAAPMHRLRLLNRFFSAELGFAGNVNNFYATGNSYLHQVLASRRGIPISLAVIYLELAEQIGLNASGVGFPGHFLIKVKLPQGEVILDPLTCDSLSRVALEEALAPYRSPTAAGRGEAGLDHYLASVSPRQILARMLRNLKEIHRSQADLLHLLSVQQRLVLLLPDEVQELRDRAEVLELLGCWAAAADDLQQYLQRSPDATDRELVQRRLRELKSRGAPGLH
ncbi:MAG: transglutaminase [Methylibium sp.]|nr:transglutaminase [Methylibium sp.]